MLLLIRIWDGLLVDIQYLFVLTDIILCGIQWLKTILKLVPKIVMLHSRTWKHPLKFVISQSSIIIQTHSSRRAPGPQNFSIGQPTVCGSSWSLEFIPARPGHVLPGRNHGSFSQVFYFVSKEI